MSSVFGLGRRLVHGDEAKASYRDEASLLQRPGAAGSDPAFAAEMEAISGDGDAYLVGEAALDERIRVWARSAAMLGRHGVVNGASGSGKSFEALSLMKQDIERFARPGPSARRRGLGSIEHKGETADLTLSLLAQAVSELDRAAARDLIDAIVHFNPFRADRLLPLNVLLPDPTLAPAEQAYEVVSLVDHASGASVGINQDDYLYHLALMAISDGRLDFGDLLTLSYSPQELADVAGRSPSPEVQLFFRERRLSAASLQGVQARLRRLLRVPTVKEMLCARGCVSFKELLDRMLLVADLSPSHGNEDVARFVSGLVSLKFYRGVFQRTADDARRPVQVYIDEFQEGIVGTGGHVADGFERILVMSRARGVGLTLITQTFDRIARVAPTLPRVILANVNFQMQFRSTYEDARQMAYLLPVTGRRPKPAPAPWERREGSPWMSKSEELEKLVEELTRLPTRQFYFYNRESPFPAVLVRAPLLKISPKPGRLLPCGNRQPAQEPIFRPRQRVPALPAAPSPPEPAPQAAAPVPATAPPATPAPEQDPHSTRRPRRPRR